MKKAYLRAVAIFLTCIGVFMIFCGCGAHNTVDAEYRLIRIHIRADSNEEADQSVKMLVKEEVTEYLNRELGGAKSFEEAYSGLEQRLGEIESIADSALRENGFDYGARAKLNYEYFPARSYEDVVVDGGYYDALILELGSGKGDNWWCVIYPPLCYVKASPGNGIRYRSKIRELWERFIKRGESEK